MNKLRTLLLGIMTTVGLATAPLLPSTVLAQSPIDSIQGGVTSVGGTQTGTQDLQDKIKTVVNVLLFLLGAVAVIMIIIGGIRYATSNGDAQAVKSAKDVVLYAVIGLVVAILAYAIVNFVLGAFKS
ncbi:MAG: hypothetical protein H6797_05855 [Candidatus Nomurabacteria bacterium]|nr:MAG: hypothetical protein H6797_05855 [Candidatus Nomurabacteria bacterium]